MMKKIILLFILFFGIFPVLQKGKFCLVHVGQVYADDYGNEGDGDSGNYTPPDYSGLYSTLSNFFGFDIVGTTLDPNGVTLFVLAGGGLLNPIGTTITDAFIQSVVDDNPDLFPGEIPDSADFVDVEDFLNYVDDLSHISEIPDDHTNATNNVLNDCLKGLVSQTMARDPDNPFSNILNTTFGSSTENNIDFSEYSDPTTTNIDGNTGGQIGCVTVEFNIAALQYASQEERMATIYHEILHAYMNQIGISKNLQHDKMANEYLEIIISQLKSDFPNLSNDDAKSLAWGGLSNTTRWNKLSDNEKNNYLSRDANFKNLNNVNNGQYGTPCIH